MYEKYEIATIAGGYVFYIDGVPKSVSTSINDLFATAISGAIAEAQASSQSFTLDQVRRASGVVSAYMGRGQGNWKISMIRDLRATTGLGLKGSKELIEAILP